MHLTERFETKFAQLFPTREQCLLALSGGIDSVVLLHLLTQLSPRPRLRAVHIHHGLSPNADAWAEFCRKLCKSLHVPLEVRKVHVGTRGGSLETLARHARYTAIAEIIAPSETLLTAHHLDDQVETFFLALKRGSGVKGLGAMAERTRIHDFPICRPLLSFHKAELREYAEQQGLRWVEDESNDTNDFDRNFLRNEVLPLLNARWEQFGQMVARTSQHCANQQALLDTYLTQDLEGRVKNSKILPLDEFLNYPEEKRSHLIRLWLDANHVQMPSTAQMDEIQHSVILAESDRNPVIKIGQTVIRRYQNALYLTRFFADTRWFSASLSEGEQHEFPDGIGEIARRDQHIFVSGQGSEASFALPQWLEERPLRVRLGGKGSVKFPDKLHSEELKKIWQELGVPVWERDRSPLIFAGNQLLAIIVFNENGCQPKTFFDPNRIIQPTKGKHDERTQKSGVRFPRISRRGQDRSHSN